MLQFKKKKKDRPSQLISSESVSISIYENNAIFPNVLHLFYPSHFFISIYLIWFVAKVDRWEAKTRYVLEFSKDFLK